MWRPKWLREREGDQRRISELDAESARERNKIFSRKGLTTKEAQTLAKDTIVFAQNEVDWLEQRSTVETLHKYGINVPPEHFEAWDPNLAKNLTQTGFSWARRYAITGCSERKTGLLS